MKRMVGLKATLALSMACWSLSPVMAQNAATGAAPAPYPVSRVTLVTHSSPGGGSDVFLRELSKHLSGVMKTNFAVENIRGGSGAKAVAHVAKGPTDGSMFYGTTPTYIQTTLLSKPSVGSYGTQVVFSRIHLRCIAEDLSSRYTVVERTALYQSPISLTPYLNDSLMDAKTLGVIIDNAYQASGLHPDDIDAGAVILTGEALRRENSESIAAV